MARSTATTCSMDNSLTDATEPMRAPRTGNWDRPDKFLGSLNAAGRGSPHQPKSVGRPPAHDA
jgi:hypothetical protein